MPSPACQIAINPRALYDIYPVLSKSALGLNGACFGHDDLPKLDMPGAEGPGAR